MACLSDGILASSVAFCQSMVDVVVVAQASSSVSPVHDEISSHMTTIVDHFSFATDSTGAPQYFSPRLGLVTYGGATASATKVHDLSASATSLRNAISGSRPASSGGNCLSCGLALAYQLLMNNGRTGVDHKHIILLLATGQNLGGTTESAIDFSNLVVKPAGIEVTTMQFATDVPSGLLETSVQQIASSPASSYSFGSSTAQISSFLSQGNCLEAPSTRCAVSGPCSATSTYGLFTSGGCETPLTVKEECEYAAATLGFSAAAIQQQSNAATPSSVPPYCVFANRCTDLMFYSGDVTGEANTGSCSFAQPCICRVPSPPPAPPTPPPPPAYPPRETLPHHNYIWTIKDGSNACELSSDGWCVSDGPDDYGNQEGCTIQANINLNLYAPSFQTETFYDCARHTLPQAYQPSALTPRPTLGARSLGLL